MSADLGLAYYIEILVFLMSEQNKKMVKNAVEPPENNENNVENGDDDLDEVEQVNEEGKLVNKNELL